MKITSKILHYPPYISTPWAFVQALYLKNDLLVVCLKDSTLIEIPNLSPNLLEAIFTAHAQFLETDRTSAEINKEAPPKARSISSGQDLPNFPFMNPETFSLPENMQPSPDENNDPLLRFGFGSMENMGGMMHHNSAQANMPDLPQEILKKIAAVAKIVAPEEVQTMPKPEPHCNCTYCQIARALQQAVEAAPEQAVVETQDSAVEEEVSDAELTFQQWEIIQTGERLYSVINRLDSHEKYSVYLGRPVGCTCGKEGCEHILAVLKS